MDEEVVIYPKRGRLDPGLPEDLILCPMKHFGGVLLTRALGWKRGFKRFRSFPTFKIEGQRAALASPATGAPMAVSVAEKGIACGSKRLWLFGCCGSLNEGLRVGDFLIPEDGVSEEGTSSHYPLPGAQGFPSDPSMRNALSQALGARGYPFREGHVWTTDAPYRETRSKVSRYAEEGVLGVEMEYTALSRLAAYRGVRFAALFLVSDELFSLKWRPGFLDRSFLQGIWRGAQVMLEAISLFTSSQASP